MLLGFLLTTIGPFSTDEAIPARQSAQKQASHALGPRPLLLRQRPPPKLSGWRKLNRSLPETPRWRLRQRPGNFLSSHAGENSRSSRSEIKTGKCVLGRHSARRLLLAKRSATPLHNRLQGQLHPGRHGNAADQAFVFLHRRRVHTPWLPQSLGSWTEKVRVNGIAVFYKSNAASFLYATNPSADASIPNFISPEYQSDGKNLLPTHAGWRLEIISTPPCSPCENLAATKLSTAPAPRPTSC